MASFNGPKLTNPIRTDVPDTQEVLAALVKQDPTSISDIPVGAKRMYEASNGKWQWQEYNGSSWVVVPFLQHNVDQLDGYHAAIAPAANTVAVRNSDKQLEGDITGNAATASSALTLSQTLPVNKGGTGATTSEAARSNLGVPPTSHASTNTTHGVGNATQYGHLKLSDATNNLSGVTGGVAATPAAVKAAKDAADTAKGAADDAMEKASTLATATNPGIAYFPAPFTIGADGKVEIRAATTGRTGIVQLNDTVTSTSTAQAATAKAVKTAYDKAVAAEAAIANALPVGALLASFASSMSGYLLCNGAAVSRTTYADLFALLGTAFGNGNGSTTFNLPDFRDKTFWGANGNLKKVIAAGLPNAEGSFDVQANSWSGTASLKNLQGVFRATGSNFGGDYPEVQNQWANFTRKYLFKLSYADDTYGNSDTVQPPAIAVNIFIKY